MGLHEDEVSMLRESLPEFLELASMGLDHKKANGGRLGYPTVALLMVVVDAIGSFHRKDAHFRVQIDGHPRQINKTGDHIYVLNSPYFGCSYTKQQLLDIYLLCRCLLTHNGLVGKGHVLEPGVDSDPPFSFKEGRVVTSVAGLLKACRNCLDRFMPQLEKVVPKSEAIRESRGQERAFAQARGTSGSPGAFSAQATAQASGIGRKT